MSFAVAGRLNDDSVRDVIGVYVEHDAATLVVTQCSLTDFCLYRFTANGARQSDFGTNGVTRVSFSAYNVSSLKASSWRSETGDLLIGATCTYVAAPSTACVLMLNRNGERNVDFASGGQLNIAKGASDFVETVTRVADGTFVTGGVCWDGVAYRFCYARFDLSGQLLTGSNSLVIATSSVSAFGLAQILPLSSGGVLLIGTCNIAFASKRYCVLRMTDSLVPDVAYGEMGLVTVPVGDDDAVVAAATLVGHSNVMLAGRCGLLSGSSVTPRFCTVAIDASGQLVHSFANNGKSIVSFFGVPTVVMSAFNEKTVVAGDCPGPGTARNLCMIRLNGGPYNPLTCALNADANQAIDTATDSLLLTRYLLGLRGDAHTTGALGQNPTRTGQALENHLASLNLDADGDGQSLAMTDGLLILRAMLGLTGDALTAGAVNTAHPNARNAQQILTWIESTHGVACLP